MFEIPTWNVLQIFLHKKTEVFLKNFNKQAIIWFSNEKEAFVVSSKSTKLKHRH